MLFPHGRVRWRVAMTTVLAPNVLAHRHEGALTLCGSRQGVLQRSWLPRPTRAHAVNSINFARVMAQIVYYFWAAVSHGAPDRPSPSRCRPATSATSRRLRAVSAWACRSPLWWRPTATTSWRVSSDPGAMTGERNSTYSPSMDIQISSSFACCSTSMAATARHWRGDGDSAAQVRSRSAPMWAACAKLFDAGRLDEGTLRPSPIAASAPASADPHTVGYAVAQQHGACRRADGRARRAPAGFPTPCRRQPGGRRCPPGWAV